MSENTPRGTAGAGADVVFRVRPLAANRTRTGFSTIDPFRLYRGGIHDSRVEDWLVGVSQRPQPYLLQLVPYAGCLPFG